MIDDPISSLSHIYIFNVAQLIKQYFINPKQKDFIQIFILTHSLYFFHELVNWRYTESNDANKKKLQKFFRIIKSGTSKIQEMKYSEIRNDYESYWDVVNNSSQENMPLVANAIRNIIEYFFGFIDKEDGIRSIFKKDRLKDNKYQAFNRYMNRESHSDLTNLSDYNEFDLDAFKEAFKGVFKEAGHEQHYHKYI